MSKRLIVLLLALSVGLNVGVIATTLIHGWGDSQDQPPLPGDGHPDQGPPPSPEQFVEIHLQGITRHLGLDVTQQQAIREVLEPHAPLLLELQSDVARTGRELAASFAAPEFDPQGFRQLAVAVGTARARMDSLSAVMLVAEGAVLTPEQRLRFSTVEPMISGRPQRGPGGPPRRATGARRRPSRTRALEKSERIRVHVR